MDRTRAQLEIRTIVTTWRTAIERIHEASGAADWPALVDRVNRHAMRMLDDLERRSGFDDVELRRQLKIARDEVEGARADDRPGFA